MKLRLRIVNFLGTLGGSGNVAILQNNKPVDLSKAIAWDSEEHLSFALPFQDMKPTIFLGMCSHQSKHDLTLAYNGEIYLIIQFLMSRFLDAPFLLIILLLLLLFPLDLLFF